MRFFPPTAAVGRWLASSSLTLTAPQAAEGRPEQGVGVESLWVSLDSPAPGAVTGTFEVTITFSNAVSGFTGGDISVANGRTVGLSGSGRTYTAEVEPAADGTVVVRVPAGVARDDWGRGNDVSGPLTRVRVSRGGVVQQGIDTWDRAGVFDAYFEEFDRAEPDWEYTGDVDNCVAGTTGQHFRDSVFQRLNWYRRMAGLSTVEENEESSAGAQQSALMMLAEGRLSHEPDSAWACYSSTGRAYAGSNLGLGTRVGGLAGIDYYMQDPGEENTEVGHRRWILYPADPGDGYRQRPQGLQGYAWKQGGECSVATRFQHLLEPSCRAGTARLRGMAAVRLCASRDGVGQMVVLVGGSRLLPRFSHDVRRRGPGSS